MLCHAESESCRDDEMTTKGNILFVQVVPITSYWGVHDRIIIKFFTGLLFLMLLTQIKFHSSQCFFITEHCIGISSNYQI